MLLTEFFSSPEGDSYADHQATKKASENEHSQAQTNEHIVKVKDGYRLVSKKTGKNLGTYPTRAGAEKRERQVQYFKHANEDMSVSNLIATEAEGNEMSDAITAKGLAAATARDPKARQEYFANLERLRKQHGKEYSTKIHQLATSLSSHKAI